MEKLTQAPAVNCLPASLAEGQAWYVRLAQHTEPHSALENAVDEDEAQSVVDDDTAFYPAGLSGI